MSTEAPGQRVFPGLLTACALTIVGAWTPFFWWELFKSSLGPLQALSLAWLLGYGLVGLLAARKVPPPRGRRLGLVLPAWSHWLYLVLLLPALPLGFEVQALNRLAWGRAPAAGIYEWSHRLLAHGSEGALVENLLLFGLVLPALVEWFFRGLIQQGLVSRAGLPGGLLATSGLYALAITGLGGDPSIWAGRVASSLLWGLLLGLLRIASGSLLAPVVLHAGMSLAWMLCLGRVNELPIAACTAPGAHVPWLILAPSLLSVGVAVYLLARQASRTYPGRSESS